MSDFARSARIAELYNKSLYWSETRIENYYENTAPFLSSPVAFEKYLNGYITATPNKINYVQLTTGDRFVYKNKDQLAWTALTDLYNASATTDFKIETPLFRSEHDQKEYLEIRTPNKEIGSPFSVKMFHDQADADTLEALLINWIDDVSACLKVVKPITVTHNIGIPKGLFNPNNYLQDSLGNRYFTNLEDNWSVLITSDFSKPAESMFSKFRTGKFSHPMAVGNIDELTERARALWT